MTSKEILEFLCAQRKKKKMTQLQLGGWVGVSRNTILNVERAKRDTGFFTVCAIANALGYELTLAKRKKE